MAAHAQVSWLTTVLEVYAELLCIHREGESQQSVKGFSCTFREALNHSRACAGGTNLIVQSEIVAV